MEPVKLKEHKMPPDLDIEDRGSSEKAEVPPLAAAPPKDIRNQTGLEVSSYHAC